MDSFDPSFNVSIDRVHCVVRFAASGMWEEKQIKEASVKIGEAAAPFILAKQRFSMLGDYSEAITQSQQAAIVIRSSIETAVKLGLARIGVVGASALVKMQYKRMDDIVEIEFFDTKVEALQWLRSNKQAA